MLRITPDIAFGEASRPLLRVVVSKSRGREQRFRPGRWPGWRAACLAAAMGMLLEGRAWAFAPREALAAARQREVLGQWQEALSAASYVARHAATPDLKREAHLLMARVYTQMGERAPAQANQALAERCEESPAGPPLVRRTAAFDASSLSPPAEAAWPWALASPTPHETSQSFSRHGYRRLESPDGSFAEVEFRVDVSW